MLQENTWINTLVSNDESSELSYQVGSKDFVTEEGQIHCGFLLGTGQWCYGNQLLGSRRRCLVPCRWQGASS